MYHVITEVIGNFKLEKGGDPRELGRFVILKD
jgi:hypothetical protein